MAGFTEATPPPWFEQAERRLHIEPWLMAVNQNNGLLQRAASKPGFETVGIRRNVKECRNLGSCGMGCPTSAKQSMLVTTIVMGGCRMAGDERRGVVRPDGVHCRCRISCCMTGHCFPQALAPIHSWRSTKS